ncbi:hypothetical protein IX296_002906 [Bacteroides pyogenes]|nr:hypothetical protein [Bacteroides pyogenes]MBR8755672.1 hypothetical protein [Bacteroides pyogenes]MBR8797023.1 hypothetical protein [Bacteroides pyogenes]MBR8810591.1 hypothetical protein [Bacteroides pyogenes]
MLTTVRKGYRAGMLLVGRRGYATFKSPLILTSAFAFVDDGYSSRSNIIDCHGKIKVYRHGGINPEGLLTHFFLYSIPDSQSYLVLTSLREQNLSWVFVCRTTRLSSLKCPFILIGSVTTVVYLYRYG